MNTINGNKDIYVKNELHKNKKRIHRRSKREVLHGKMGFRPIEMLMHVSHVRIKESRRIKRLKKK